MIFSDILNFKHNGICAASSFKFLEKIVWNNYLKALLITMKDIFLYSYAEKITWPFTFRLGKCKYRHLYIYLLCSNAFVSKTHCIDYTSNKVRTLFQLTVLTKQNYTWIRTDQQKISIPFQNIFYSSSL